MREFVGVKSMLQIIFSYGLNQGTLKRESLIFNRIAVPTYTDALSDLRSEYAQQYLGELDWLFEKGVAFEPEAFNLKLPAYDECRIYSDEEDRQFSIVDTLEKDSPNYERDYLFHIATADECRSRLVSKHLRALDLDAYPVFTTPVLFEVPSSNKSEVVKIALNALPIPDESISWEQILEYRSDPDSQSKFLALRHWMSEVARAELTPAEVEEKLEYLINQYRQHMRLHRMKTNVGTLETIVTTSAEFLGDLVSFKWGKAAEALFSLKRRQVALLEGELTAPGNEVAYIVKARETFETH